MERGRWPSPSALFDAAAYPAGEAELDRLGLEVVARPGMEAPIDVKPGYLAIRRALGEGRLAVLCAVNRMVEGRTSLEATGVVCEGRGDGVFIEVDGGPSGRRTALRLAGPDGLVVRDTVLLRPRRTVPARSRRAPAKDTGPSPRTILLAAAAEAGEGVDDPITQPRTPLSITGSVGRGGQNLAPDVRAVQARLVALRALDATDATTERPPDSAAAGESALPRTIEAIERFQRQLGVPIDGKFDVRGVTRTDLDRAVPHPTAAELAAVTTERNAVRQSVSRGLTITGPVGATAGGNAPDDVRAVQRRLVELGKLSASHRETPLAGATAAVPQASLRATVAALRALQADVRFWLARGTVSGAITPGVAAPGDATAALLDRISVYGMTVGSDKDLLPRPRRQRCHPQRGRRDVQGNGAALGARDH